jgi:hypothetical protein
VWRIREVITDGPDKGRFCKGKLHFQGFVDEPSKGTLQYTGCAAEGQQPLEGKGRWLLKPASITGGKILFSARWKVSLKNTAAGTTTALLYRGDVVLVSHSDVSKVLYIACKTNIALLLLFRCGDSTFTFMYHWQL